MIKPGLEFVYEATGSLGAPVPIGETPDGVRRMIPIFAGPVTLKANPVDDDGQVTLGEIFEGAGGAAKIGRASCRERVYTSV